MIYFKKQLEYILTKTIFIEIFFFILVFGYLAWLNNQPVQVDPDSFYHAKITVFLAQGELLKNFPWFSATLLNNIWIDHHFLYHLLILPFVLFTNPLVGIKLATIFYAFIYVVVFYLILNKLEIKYSLFYAFVLVLTTSFLFRLSLAKAPALSLTFLFFAFYLLCLKLNQKGRLALFFVSFFYVWLYGGWPILLVISLVFWLTEASVQLIGNSKINSFKVNLLDSIRKSDVIKFFFRSLKKNFTGNHFVKLIMVMGGLAAGIIINPYFPTNLKFYWWQTILIPFKNYKNIIGVGGEWYPFNVFDLIGSSVIVVILLVLATVSLAVYWKKQKSRTKALFFLTILFLTLTLKSRRHVEYFVPFALFFCASSLNTVFQEKSLKEIWQKVLSFIPKKFALVLFIYLFLGLSLTSFDDARLLKKHLSVGNKFTSYEQASGWLKNNSAPDSVVFHSDWDETPLLFYHNSHNRYLVGLDPVFMYDYNHELYWLWHDITLALKNDDLARILKEKFKASYVFIDSDHQEMNENFKNSPGFTLVYQDSEAWIYQVK